MWLIPFRDAFGEAFSEAFSGPKRGNARMPEYGAGGFTASGASLTGSTAPDDEDDGSRAVIDVHHHFCA